MPLHTSIAARERILVTGGSGMGKSYDWLKVAQLSAQTKSPAHFTVVDTDFAIARMLETEFGGLDNVTLVESAEWTVSSSTIKSTARTMAPDDWLIVDLLSPTWEQVQEHFTDEVFGQDIDNYFLQARAAAGAGGKSASAFDGWTDWTVINKMYKSMMNNLLRARGHVYATTVADPVPDTAEKEIKAIFGQHGMKPRGQKHTPHFFHTCLIKTLIGDSRRVITAKDRGRAMLTGTEINNFPMDYLVKVAGWSLGAA